MRTNKPQIKNQSANTVEVFALVVFMTFAFLGCGDSSSSASADSKFISANSLSSITGTWTLVAVNENAILETDAAILAVGDDHANGMGAINARLISDTELGFDYLNDAGQFVDFQRSAEVNRSRVIGALKAGAFFKLSDSILTLQDSEGTLVFVPAK